jgi:hypothetical protein
MSITPLSMLFGFFVDYTQARNHRYLYFHPGYYYHYWHYSGTGYSGAQFRGGGPAFGK